MSEHKTPEDANTTVAGLSRRQFVTTIAGAGAFMIVPRRVLGRGGHLLEAERTEYTAHPPCVGEAGVRRRVLRSQVDSAMKMLDRPQPVFFDELPQQIAPEQILFVGLWIHGGYGR